MYYYSTRNKNNKVTASQAILNGIAQDGGLYVPLELPKLSFQYDELVTMSYQEIAYMILQPFLSDFTKEELMDCIHKAYNHHKFDSDTMVNVVSFNQKHFLELFHGQTIAFKDMALSILPYLMTTAAKKNNDTKTRLILTATSGDTGKAAMAGFANVPNTKIIVFYPKGGVSKVQELQMITQTGNNTHVVAVEGNFDDAQSAIKTLLTDTKMIATINELGYQFSSANSINIGRLVPQIVYYVYAYVQLIKQNQITPGQFVHVAVPTGNFGNILAAYYAKQLGLPIQLLLCASNKNNVLADFLQTGSYNKNRPFYLTNSPSMDILISSNLERLLFHATHNNHNKTAQFMSDLMTTGTYTIDDSIMMNFNQFIGDFANEQDIEAHIHQFYTQHQYLMDPHTAVASIVVDKYVKATHDNTPVIIAATASPYKFPRAVLSQFDNVDVSQDDLTLLHDIKHITQLPLPQAVLDIQHATIRHNKVSSISNLSSTILSILKGENNETN